MGRGGRVYLDTAESDAELKKTAAAANRWGGGKTSIVTTKKRGDRLNTNTAAADTELQSTTDENAVDVGNALNKIAALLKERKLQCFDLFRDPRFNVSAVSRSKGDDSLSASEFRGVLSRAGVRANAQDVDALIAYMDDDGNGQLDIRELDAALRSMRRQNAIGRAFVPDAAKVAAGAAVAAKRAKAGAPRSPKKQQLAILRLSLSRMPWDLAKALASVEHAGRGVDAISSFRSISEI
jgi:hypothetical protein